MSPILHVFLSVIDVYTFHLWSTLPISYSCIKSPSAVVISAILTCCKMVLVEMEVTLVTLISLILRIITSLGFELIGKNNEQAPLKLEDYMSYDEMAVGHVFIDSPSRPRPLYLVI